MDEENGKSPDDSHEEQSLEGGMVRPETRQVARSLVLRTCLPSMIVLHAPCLSPYLLRQEVCSRIICWQKFPDSDLASGAPRLTEAKVPYSSSGLSLLSAWGRTKPRTSSPTYPFPHPHPAAPWGTIHRLGPEACCAVLSPFSPFPKTRKVANGRLHGKVQIGPVLPDPTSRCAPVSIAVRYCTGVFPLLPHE